MTANVEAALDYARRGWPVFPCHYVFSNGKCSCGKPDCHSPAKHPMTLRGLQDATSDEKIIRNWWGKHPKANIGILTGSASGLVVVDIDPRSGGMESLKAIKKLGNFPVTPEVFTGGGGEHIYLAHPGNGTKIKTTANMAGYRGIDLKGDGGYVIAPPSKHISGGKYTWKRHHLKNKLAPMPAWLVNLVNGSRQGLPQVVLEKKGVPYSGSLIKEGQRDIAIFNLVRTLRKGGMAYEDVCQHAVMFAKNCCDPPWTEKEAIAKVNSTWNAERNIGADIKEFLKYTQGTFRLCEIKDWLQVTNQRDYGLLKVTIHRLVKANVLERIEKQPGVYRVVERDVEEIALEDEDDNPPLNIKWPFGLENLVDIMPKNIIVLAGTKDSGKSAFCMNTIKLNMHSWDIRYFSSEMGEQELKRRLRRHDDMKLSDWKFKAYMRASNFADVIFPEAFNIIDYLEISKDFHMVSEDIRKIYDRLTTGIALVALQKDKDAEYGRGKSFSLEKARMYLTLDKHQFHNTLTIKSGKNWHQEGVNPAGIEVKYKIVNGAKLIEYE